MLKDQVTALEIDILLFLYEQDRTAREIADFLSIKKKSVSVYLRRLIKNKFISMDSETLVNSTTYSITDNGLFILEYIRERLEAR